MKHKASGWLVAGLLLLAAAQAWAGGVGAVRKTVEATMVLTGSIQVDTQGRVTGYSIDKQEQVDPAALQVVGGVVPAWRFEPVLVNGTAVPATSKMTLRLVASQRADGGLEVRAESVSFSGEPKSPEEQILADKMAPPKYPVDAARSGIQGQVFLLLKVGRDGRVQDVAVERTNLWVVGRENQLPGFRRSLEQPALEAARKWTYKVPVAGPGAHEDAFQVRVPVAYALGVREAEHYGRWRAYVPGPLNQVPWRDARFDDRGIDAGIGGQVQLAGAGLRLLSDLGQSG